MKKKISFLVVMLLGLFVFSHESKAETYYFDNTNTQWEHVSVWSWSDGLDQLWQMDNNLSAWPGIELTKDDASGYYVWEAYGELPSDGAVMYNNGGEGVGNTEQICDALAYEAYGNAGKVCVPTVKNTAEDEENNPKRKEGLWYGEWVNYEVKYLSKVELKVEKCTATSVDLKWDKVPNADGYIVERYNNDVDKWEIVSTMDLPGVTLFGMGCLEPATEYSFRVKAYKAVTDKTIYSEYSTVSVRTVFLKTSGFSYIIRTATKLHLMWNKNTGADGYILEQYKGGKWVVIDNIKGTTGYEMTGLKPGTSNKFRIKAYKYDGTSKIYSPYTTLTVKTLPSTVKGFTFSGRTASTVTLKWTKNTSAEGYVIQQYKSGKWKTIKTIAGNSTVKYKVTGLKPSVNYKFRIKAYTKDGSTKLYSASYSTKSVKTVPSTVKGFTYKSRTAKTITLKWYKNNSADGYLIQQYKGGKWVTIKTITKKSTVNYKVTGLKKNTSYKFRIKAYKKDNSKKLYSVSYSNRTVKTLKK